MMEKIIAVDLGGTSIKSALFVNGKIKEKNSVPTDAKRGADHVMEKLIQLIESYENAEAIGISTCGSVNRKDGSIHYANENMPGYTGTKVKSILESHFHIPCSVENDAICAAIGEKNFGAGRQMSDFAMLTYGTGVGAGIYLNSKPYYGNGYNTCPFIGGIYMQNEGTMYENCASTTALVRNIQKIRPEVTNAKVLFEKKQSADVLAIMDKWYETVALGLCSIVHLYNLPSLIIGGGILEQQAVYNAIEQKFHAHLLSGFRGTEIRKASLGNEAGMYGAYYNACNIIL